MSIYRRHAGLVYAVADPVNRINRDPSPGAGSAYELTRECEPSPDALILPHTQEWSDALPRRVRPYALCKLYPRIANMIAIRWADVRFVSADFDRLLVGRRRGRRGFPLDVLNDLCVLRDYRAGSAATSWDRC
jgi:hypothetical protein